MDKQDIIYGVAAVAIILVMAVVVKPMITGHPVNTGIPVATTTPVPVTTALVTTISLTTSTPVPATSAPTPVPTTTWNRQSQTVGFVNSSEYGIVTEDDLPNSSRFDTYVLNTTTTSFARINGKYSGTTQVISIPSPYWELVYTVDPVAPSQHTSVTIEPTKRSEGGYAGVGYSGIQGSYSGALPEFTIQVMDAQDPNRVVRTISPPGGIDLNLWQGVKATTNPDIISRKKAATTASDIPYVDPRPWTEKFYEGQRSYYFIINAQFLKSYSIDIRVPNRYLGTF